jgi:hypothetical protein
MRIPLRDRQGSSLKSLEALEPNFGLSMVKGIKPRDDTEAMLATQMAAMHKKRTRQPCRAPAVRGWTVCRCHARAAGRQRAIETAAIDTEAHGQRQPD